jgi:serine/threonine-protein kinase
MMKLPPRYVPKGPPVAGGFGAAVLCRDTALNRDVLVKEILDPAQVMRMIDEIAALHAAKSKHVVEVFDVVLSPDGKNLAIVEEYLPGNDLSKLTFDPKVPNNLLKLIYQISRGIADVHDRNIVHRDIKPDNMKLDAEGYVKIFDFGLAKGPALPGSTTSLTGTVGFMAPELFFSPPQIDKPVDVYAFGAMLFVFVTGKLPPCARPWPQPPVALKASESIAAAGFKFPRLAPLIDACLNLDPAARPIIGQLTRALAKELLYGKHRATITSPTKTLVLGIIGDKAKATHGLNLIELTYDGYDFLVSQLSGHVFVNNQAAVTGQVLDGAHVLTLGASGARLFITFDVSHPEVEL